MRSVGVHVRGAESMTTDDIRVCRRGISAGSPTCGGYRETGWGAIEALPVLGRASTNSPKFTYLIGSAPTSSLQRAFFYSSFNGRLRFEQNQTVLILFERYAATSLRINKMTVPGEATPKRPSFSVRDRSDPPQVCKRCRLATEDSFSETLSTISQPRTAGRERQMNSSGQILIRAAVN